MLILNTLVGILFGTLLIIYSEQIAAYIKSTVNDSIVRDIGSPGTYKVLGFLGITFSILSLLLSFLS